LVGSLFLLMVGFLVLDEPVLMKPTSTELYLIVGYLYVREDDSSFAFYSMVGDFYFWKGQ